MPSGKRLVYSVSGRHYDDRWRNAPGVFRKASETFYNFRSLPSSHGNYRSTCRAYVLRATVWKQSQVLYSFFGARIDLKCMFVSILKKSSKLSKYLYLRGILLGKLVPSRWFDYYACTRLWALFQSELGLVYLGSRFRSPVIRRVILQYRTQGHRADQALWQDNATGWDALDMCPGQDRSIACLMRVPSQCD